MGASISRKTGAEINAQESCILVGLNEESSNQVANCWEEFSQIKLDISQIKTDISRLDNLSSGLGLALLILIGLVLIQIALTIAFECSKQQRLKARSKAANIRSQAVTAAREVRPKTTAFVRVPASDPVQGSELRRLFRET